MLFLHGWEACFCEQLHGQPFYGVAAYPALFLANINFETLGSLDGLGNWNREQLVG